MIKEDDTFARESDFSTQHVAGENDDITTASMAGKAKKSSPEALLKKARKQFEAASSASATERDEAEQDMQIYNGHGIWDDSLRTSRVNDPLGARPCFTISDLPPRVRQITNDVRQNKPSIKIRPVDSDADVGTAEILDGLIRHIEQQSNANTAYETANFYQTVTGTGYFRIVEKYSRESRKKELYIEPILNPSSVFVDPLALDPVGANFRYAFIAEDMPRDEYEEEYGKDDIVEFSEGSADSRTGDWQTEDTVRIAEWMHLEDYDMEIDELEDDGFTKKTERMTHCVWRKISGAKILKEVILPISYVPVFRVPGEMFIDDNKVVYKGLVRDSRDAARMVSYSFSAYIESITTQTKTPYIGAAGAFDGFENDWQRATTDNLAFLEYNSTDSQGNPAGAPQRQPPPMASQGLINGLVLSQQALKDVTGMGAASLGQKGNETSGRAINARVREGDVSTYHYPDNLAKAIAQAGRVLVQWIPHVYKDRDVIRIIGLDGETSQVRLDPNQQESVRKEEDYEGNTTKIYNICMGCYDVVSTVGPSYSTQRQESSEFMGQVFQAAPQMFSILGDIFFQNQDTPGAAEMAKRLKAMLPPEIAAVANAEAMEDIPPQVRAQMQSMQQQLQEGGEIVQASQAKIAELETQLNSKAEELQIKMADTEASTENATIKSIADIQVAQINANNRKDIALMQAGQKGMQDEMAQMKNTIAVFMETLKDSTGANSPGDKGEQ